MTKRFDVPGKLAMADGPWGSGPGSNGEDGDGGKRGGPRGDDNSGGGSGGGPRNPWTPPPSGGGPRRPRGPTALDELLRRGREGFGGFPRRPDGRPLWPVAIGIIIVLWVALTCVHRVGPGERGIVTLFGAYSRTLSPGINLTLPAPMEAVEIVDVEDIRTIDIGTTGSESENLVLTGDQNIIDLAYSVRWNIRNAEQYRFQLADPDATIREVAESAMRAVVGTVNLDEAMGAGRAGIETQVANRMQDILDIYRSGIRIQGVAIKQADPPAAVNDAFKEVSAAQQTAQSYLNDARAYAQQLSARAQGEATAFDKVYEQYRLAPGVTRRRMYYETMEQVLGNVDKTVIETDKVTPYLPLPEVQRRARQSQPDPAQPAQAQAPADGKSTRP